MFVLVEVYETFEDITSSTIFDNHDVNHTNDVLRFSRSMLVNNEMAKQTSGKEKVPSEVTESQLMSSNVS
jgi:hypothetical protein